MGSQQKLISADGVIAMQTVPSNKDYSSTHRDESFSAAARLMSCLLRTLQSGVGISLSKLQSVFYNPYIQLFGIEK